MKSSTIRLAELSLLLAAVDARANPKVIGYDITRRDASPISSTVYNYFNGWDYTINITVGSPPQPVMVTVDTGSSNLILNSPQSDFCKAGNCTAYGSYDPAQSSSSKWYNNLMEVEYEIEAMQGDWVTDDVTFGGKTLPQVTIGSGNKSNSDINLWGFGFSGLGDSAPPGIPSNDTTLTTIRKAGLINSASVGIYLNKTGSPTGSMILGGIDTSLYTGDLQVLPMVPSNGFYDRLAVTLETISYGDGSSGGNTTQKTTSSLPTRVMLDTGNFDIKLPADIAADIQKSFGITKLFPVAGYEFALTSCSMADSTEVVGFGFGGARINVPMSSLVVLPPASVLASYGLPPDTLPEGVCMFLINGLDEKIIEAGSLPYILGSAFLSNAYFVSNEDSHEVGLAQANFNPGPSNILEIPAGKTGLAGLGKGTPTGNTGGGNSTGGAVPSATPTGDATRSWRIPAGWIVASAGVFGVLLSL